MTAYEGHEVRKKTGKISMENLPAGRLFSLVVWSGTSTKSSVLVDRGVVGFDECLAEDFVVFIVGTRLFTGFGDGERRFVVDCDGIGNVFGRTSASYSGIGSI